MRELCRYFVKFFADYKVHSMGLCMRLFPGKDSRRRDSAKLPICHCLAVGILSDFRKIREYGTLWDMKVPLPGTSAASFFLGCCAATHGRAFTSRRDRYYKLPILAEHAT